MVRMPSDVDDRLSLFDRFATAVANLASRAVFFALCLALVLVWAPSILVFRDVDTWQLVINTATTIVTFLLVALLQNTQRRADEALQQKLNALAVGLIALLDEDAGVDDSRVAVGELCAAVGLEDRESA